MAEDDATDIVHENTLTDVESSNVAYLSRSKLKAKRSGLEDSREERRSFRLFVYEVIERLLEKQAANAIRIAETFKKHNPITMLECIDKLRSLPDMTNEAVVAVLEAIAQNNDNKSILMNREGDLLRRWIEHVLSCHPKFGKHPAWR